MNQAALSGVRKRLQRCCNAIELQNTLDPGNVDFTLEKLLGVINKQQDEIEQQDLEIQRLRG